MRRRASPTVPVIGMLKYCSVTVREENKEAVERIEKRACFSPHCEKKVRIFFFFVAEKDIDVKLHFCNHLAK